MSEVAATVSSVLRVGLYLYLLFQAAIGFMLSWFFLLVLVEYSDFEFLSPCLFLPMTVMVFLASLFLLKNIRIHFSLSKARRATAFCAAIINLLVPGLILFLCLMAPYSLTESYFDVGSIMSANFCILLVVFSSRLHGFVFGPDGQR